MVVVSEQAAQQHTAQGGANEGGGGGLGVGGGIGVPDQHAFEVQGRKGMLMANIRVARQHFSTLVNTEREMLED